MLKKKVKSDTGSKGSLVIGARKPEKEKTEPEPFQSKHITKEKKEAEGKIDNCLLQEQKLLAANIRARNILTSPLTLGQTKEIEGFPFPGKSCIFPTRKGADTDEEKELHLRSMMAALNTLAARAISLNRLGELPGNNGAGTDMTKQEVDELYLTINKLESEKTDLKQRLEREEELVKTTKEQLNEQCGELITEKEKL